MQKKEDDNFKYILAHELGQVGDGALEANIVVGSHLIRDVVIPASL